MRKTFFPSVKEVVLVIGITVLFLILTGICIGFRPEHFLMTGLFLAENIRPEPGHSGNGKGKIIIPMT